MRQEKSKQGIELLSRMAESANPPHALLLTGVDTREKIKAGIALAKWLFHSADGRGSLVDFYNSECGCASCFAADQGSHPDFLLLDTPSVSIKEIRSLRSRFSSSPFLAERKIAIIADAASMRAEAANATLKLLEEPRGKTLLILIAPTRSGVLATIASRLVEVKFQSANSDGDYPGESTAFEGKSLADKFALIKRYRLEDREELVRLSDAWLLHERKKLISSGDFGRVDFIKKLLRAKQIISTTNTSPQLVFEELFICETQL